MVNVAAALAVALPLYSWPSPGAWNPIYSAIANNPNTTFNVIVNPNSGPGSFPPATEYIAGVAKLNSYSNVNTYGYLHTEYAVRPLSDIKSDVATYAKWNSYKASNIALDGIFVDEATDQTGHLDYMKTVASTIRTAMPKKGKIWTNPGCIVASSFYDYADIVTAFEDSYVNWNSPKRVGIPQALHNRTSVMITNYSGGLAGIKAQAKILAQRGFHSGFVWGTQSYNSYSSQWVDFANSADQS